jgi:four helix bundle protein
MKNKDFANELENRTQQFAFRILELSGKLPNSPEGKVIRNQLSKSASSIGANYREANRSRSKADFLNKIKICESESSETVYWLSIVSDLKWVDTNEIYSCYNEANEILALFTSIRKKLKSHSNSS